MRHFVGTNAFRVNAHVVTYAIVTSFFSSKNSPCNFSRIADELLAPNRRYWKDFEVAALKAGVRRHGVGKWVSILRDKDFGPYLTGRKAKLMIISAYSGCEYCNSQNKESKHIQMETQNIEKDKELHEFIFIPSTKKHQSVRTLI